MASVRVRQLVALTLVLGCFPVAAQATDCQLIAEGTAALGQLDAETRLAWLDRRLRLDGRSQLIWSVVWGTAYGALTVGQLALWPTSSSTSDRAEKIVGSSAAFIGTISVVALPPRAIADGRWWAHHRSSSHDDVCSLLHTAEELLMRDAADDEFGVSPLVHIGNFVVNIAAGLILGLGYNDWKAWGYSTLVGIAVGELQTATRPNESYEDLRRYRLGQLDHADIEKLHWGVAPVVTREWLGLKLLFNF